MMKKAILYIALIFTTIVANAQIAVNAKLDSNNITIGDQVKLTISVENFDNAILYFPTSTDFAQSKVELIAQYYDTTFDNSGKIISLNQVSTLTSFEEGVDTISNLMVRCLNTDNSLSELILDPIFLVVNDVEVDTTLAIKDIAGIVKVPYTFRDFLPWIIGVLLIAGIVFVVFYLYKRLKAKEPILPIAKPIVVAPEEKALSDLEKLRVSGLWKSGQIKEYHTILTDILRVYLEQKLGIPAIEMTTDQILDIYSEQKNMPISTREKLQQILVTADMVKFAKSEPLPNEHDRSMSYALSFVQETADVVNEQRRAEEQQKENNKPKPNNE